MEQSPLLQACVCERELERFLSKWFLHTALIWTAALRVAFSASSGILKLFLPARTHIVIPHYINFNSDAGVWKMEAVPPLSRSQHTNLETGPETTQEPDFESTNLHLISSSSFTHTLWITNSTQLILHFCPTSLFGGVLIKSGECDPEANVIRSW